MWTGTTTSAFMKIRWKFFALLLAFSLIPLVAVTMVSHQVALKTGEELSSHISGETMGIVTKELQQAAENYGRTLLEKQKVLELAVFALGDNAGFALSQDSAPPVKVYFASDFDRAVTAPPDLGPRPLYFKYLTDGRKVPAPVSLEHQVFLAPPNLAPDSQLRQVERLALLDPIFKNLYKQLGNLAYRFYVTLDNGLHTAYPGHGDYPPGYDPRQRPWFQRAAANGSVTWTLPSIDAATRRVVATASMRFFNRDGSFAGVAALDVLLTRVLGETDLSSQWASQMKSFLIARDKDPLTGDEVHLVLAKRDNASGALAWDDNFNYEVVTSAQEPGFGQLIDCVKQPSGYSEFPYQGVDSIWAYSNLAEGLCFVVVVPKSLVMAMPDRARQSILDFAGRLRVVTIVAAFMVLLAAALVAYAGSRAIIKAMTVLVEASKVLARGDYSIRLHQHWNDERDMVFNCFNEMVPKLEEHLGMSQALGLAQEVQQCLLPEFDPDVEGLDIAGVSRYCDKTGGDYYDFLKVERNGRTRIAVVVGDVSGHGISSALVMATGRAMIRLRASQEATPAEIIDDVNRHLSMDVRQTGQFMTLFYAEFDPREPTVHWVRAGHDPAKVYDPKQGQFHQLAGHGLALGLDQDYVYNQYQRPLFPGQVILIGTDGLWEARNSQGQMFGKERVRKIVKERAAEPARAILDAVLEAQQAFRGQQDRQDDVTMVVIKVDDQPAETV